MISLTTPKCSEPRRNRTKVGLKAERYLRTALAGLRRNRTKVGLKGSTSALRRRRQVMRRNRTKVGLKEAAAVLRNEVENGPQSNQGGIESDNSTSALPCQDLPQSNQGGIERVQEVLQRGQEVIAAIEPRWD